MKAAVMLFLFMVAGVGSHARVAADDPPDLQVLKYSWAKERIDWERDPFGGGDASNEARFRVLRDRNRNGSVLRQRQEREVLDESKKPPPPPRYVFSYKVAVQNTGAKTIKEIDWDYVFTDAATGELLGRREFTSVEKIAAGKRKELAILASLPPTRKISVYNLGNDEHAGVTEKAVVVRILYEDGTVWQAY
jgi:hypothetical protein